MLFLEFFGLFRSNGVRFTLECQSPISPQLCSGVHQNTALSKNIWLQMHHSLHGAGHDGRSRKLSHGNRQNRQKQG